MKSKKNICPRKQIVAYLMIISLLCLCCGCIKDKNEKECVKRFDTDAVIENEDNEHMKKNGYVLCA
ncbi:MAG: hypothetical protein IJ141_09520 [Lachnospiraceae bacterium]|nr:hypothetical protein [Lachnospiraceae bacterium]